MKTSLVFGMALGIVATTVVMNNETKIMKMYKKGRKNIMQKFGDLL